MGVADKTTRRAGERTCRAEPLLPAACRNGDPSPSPRSEHRTPTPRLSHQMRQLLPQRAVKLLAVLETEIRAALAMRSLSRQWWPCGWSRSTASFSQLDSCANTAGSKQLNPGILNHDIGTRARGTGHRTPFLVRFAAKVARRRDCAGEVWRGLKQSLIHEPSSDAFDPNERKAPAANSATEII